jgi:hypothetical protein
MERAMYGFLAFILWGVFGYFFIILPARVAMGW